MFLLLATLVPAALAATLYCPSKNDLQVAYASNTSTPEINDGGWTINGGGGASSKSSFNVLSGWISYSVNFDGTPTGVNANIYSISPKFSGSTFNPKTDYCDGNNANFCVEIDFIESNGNCGGQTTLHDVPGTGSSPNCNGWGCATSYHYGGSASFSMNVSFDASGKWTTVRNGQTLPALSPAPQQLDWDNVANSMKSHGALIYSSQWVGWVPLSDCGETGDLNKAKMTISNLRVYGDVVQGPTPTKC